ncbi:MAG: hypothetical protein E3J21_00300 [Anaerolineales bacterium]|nr:MAG: hypothetical protein E3J21_00300 [Anaerolineales bacterium]
MVSQHKSAKITYQENLQVIQAFFESHDPVSFFAEDAEFYDMSQPEPLRGREAIGAMMHMMYQEAFSDARPESQGLMAGENAVVAEFIFHGKNTGSLMGAPPTSKTVAVPMIAVYEVEGSKIQRARLYYDSATMGRQLGLIE